MMIQKSPRLEYSNSCFSHRWPTRCKSPLEVRPIHEDFRGWFDTALPLHPALVDYLNIQADRMYHNKGLKPPPLPVDDPNDPFWQEKIREAKERNARRPSRVIHPMWKKTMDV